MARMHDQASNPHPDTHACTHTLIPTRILHHLDPHTPSPRHLDTHIQRRTGSCGSSHSGGSINSDNRRYHGSGRQIHAPRVHLFDAFELAHPEDMRPFHIARDANGGAGDACGTARAVDHSDFVNIRVCWVPSHTTRTRALTYLVTQHAYAHSRT